MLAAALSDAKRFCGISNTETATIIDKKEKETEHYSSVSAGDKLAKMYEKYQEANDAFLHERLERKNAERTLKQVFHEIEQKVEMVLDERAEHERMVESYALMDQKLQDALSEHDNLDNTIRQLKGELKMRQRDYTIAPKEITDLQKQVTVLKECQDVQLRCGGIVQVSAISSLTECAADPFCATDAESIISEHLR